MQYPYNEIKEIHNRIVSGGIMNLPTMLTHYFPSMVHGIPFKRYTQTGKFNTEELNLSEDVLKIVISNLVAISAHTDMASLRQTLVNKAEGNGSITFLKGLADWIKGRDCFSIMNLTYLAHYEAANNKGLSMTDLSCTIPSEKECKNILRMADSVLDNMRYHDTYGITPIITDKEIYFLVGSALYVVTLNDGQQVNAYHPVIHRELAGQYLRNTNRPINYVTIYNPVTDSRYWIKVEEIDHEIIDIVHGCIFGPNSNSGFKKPAYVAPQPKPEPQIKPEPKPRPKPEPKPTGIVHETVVTNSRLTMLISTTFALLNSEDYITSHANLVNTLTSFPKFTPRIINNAKIEKRIFAVLNHFESPISNIDKHYHTGINMLNQLISDAENYAQPISPTVKLSDALTAQVFNAVIARFTTER